MTADVSPTVRRLRELRMASPCFRCGRPAGFVCVTSGGHQHYHLHVDRGADVVEAFRLGEHLGVEMGRRREQQLARERATRVAPPCRDVEKARAALGVEVRP